MSMITDRRSLLALLAGSLATPGLARAASTNDAAMSPVTAYAYSFAGLQGEPIRLSDFAGKPIIVVNTASLCGYTPQYAGLEQLFKRFHERGLMMVGVPSNDFGGQEPGGVAEITETANKEYGVTFPLAAKAEVVGPNAHPFYKWASGRWKRRSGISTNTWSAATAISPPCSRRPSSRWKRAWSTRWPKSLAANRRAAVSFP
jgi:glutathione peroxidase